MTMFSRGAMERVLEKRCADLEHHVVRLTEEAKELRAAEAEAREHHHNANKIALIWRERAVQHRKEREGLKSQLEAANRQACFWTRSYTNLARQVRKAIDELRNG